MNLSFQTALGTLEKVMTPSMVSLRVAHVVAKSTRFGFKDMVSRKQVQTVDIGYTVTKLCELYFAVRIEVA